LFLREVEAFARGRLGLRLRLERHGVGFQRLQHVSHLPERLEDRLPVLRHGLIICGNGGSPFCGQFPSPEERLEHPGAKIPDRRPGGEQIRGL